ncbi:steroid-binding protein 3 [Spatholobus suberectus]|nr:steroid-binding protein 3 [Spatholobus suberectus]
MELTPQQLSQYNGTDSSKPIYVAVKGRVYDVTTGKSFYGPGGAYAMFAGKDASRALAKMSKNDDDISPSLDGLSDKEIGVLNDWENKFQAKYPVVGHSNCDHSECGVENHNCQNQGREQYKINGQGLLISMLHITKLISRLMQERAARSSSMIAE